MIKKIMISLVFLFNLYASNVVIDKDMNMMWQDSNVIVKRNYYDAVKYCKNLYLGGHHDWRLPSISELMSVSDKNRYAPAIKKIFKNTKDIKNNWYWSRTQYKKNSSRAWIVNFNNIYDYYSDHIDDLFVRCVR